MFKQERIWLMGFAFWNLIANIIAQNTSGIVAFIEDHPYIVSVQKNFDFHICSGVLITRETVLTSHKCIDGLSIEDLSVRLGSSWWKNGSLYLVIKVVTSLLYNSKTLFQDYAILFLDISVNIGRTARPIEISSKSATEQRFGRIIGWNSVSTDNLYMTFTRIRSKARCHHANGTNVLPEGIFCSGNTIPTCLGDLGSPIVSKGVLLGILSDNHNCAKDGYFESIFTDVSIYKKTIESIVNPESMLIPKH